MEYRLGRAVSTEEVAASLQIAAKDVESVLAQAQFLTVTSFDEITVDGSGDSSGSPLNLLVDQSAVEAYEDVEKEEIKTMLAEAVDKLPEKEKLVVALYYQEELTLKEIAAVLKLSESRISQLHSQAIARLRGRLNRQKNLF